MKFGNRLGRPPEYQRYYASLKFEEERMVRGWTVSDAVNKSIQIRKNLLNRGITSKTIFKGRLDNPYIKDEYSREVLISNSIGYSEKAKKQTLRRSKVRSVRPTLRRGEPTQEEMVQARINCRERAKGICELGISPNCWGMRVLPLYGEIGERGHLCHLKAKRRFGWFESKHQKHLWGCPPCHAYEHAGGKPCPPKP